MHYREREREGISVSGTARLWGFGDAQGRLSTTRHPWDHSPVDALLEEARRKGEAVGMAGGAGEASNQPKGWGGTAGVREGSQEKEH